MSDVIRQLDLAADENSRLRQRLLENNNILEEKVQVIQRCLESREKEKQILEAKVRELEASLRKAEERARTARQEETSRKISPSSLSSNDKKGAEQRQY